MERTDSQVLQIAPSFENEKIQEMQHWGWKLENRQEIHEQGNAVTKRESDGYVTTTEISKYVKLHLTRPRNLPNIDRLKTLENEYNSLPYPQNPTLGWPIGLTGFFGLGVLVNLSNGVKGVLVCLVLAALCGYWLYRNINKRQVVTQVRAKSGARAHELVTEAESL